MKKSLHTCISILMAFVVLFSTVSFTVDKHFCGSILVDTAILAKAETCGMEMTSSEDTIMADSCCSNQKLAVEGQDELKHSFQSFDLDQQLFLTTFTWAYINLFEGLPEQVIPFKDYSPPLLVTDIHLVDSVFLI
ncbi:HYC_CC_PP family protein [Autumnicola psychrophila]|uniref:Secreted protein n=1 Tax=Autumnicola psychrophila TaxID=3075592 RepID=A0ABU3DSZ2_9FLAO|nr:hypothetical protein [Zunongwangia sp. F225]MDT0686202.1 hypothetical protein [Zunongwangia sp. F225]